MELPPPAVEQAPQNGASGENNIIPLETLPAAQEQAANPSVGAAAMPPAPIAIPAATNPLQFAAQGQADDTQVADPKLLQDKDLIEKEWVNKAKAIIEKNREDPFKQSEDITLLKADYMKKQFNKTLKLNK
jgi:hypothetical protein